VAGPGERSPILVLPVLQPRSLDEAAEGQARRVVEEAWAAWDKAVEEAPAARARLEQIARLLPEVEAQLAVATRGLEAARAAYVRRLLGPGGGMLMGPTGEGTYMTHEDEENRDPGIVVAKAERQTWIDARSRLWQHAENARAVIAHAESQRPPGQRPRD
jgi:hypothetical protein